MAIADSLPRVMKKEFQATLDLAGVWVAYGRQDKRFPCHTCASLETRDAPATCADCFGSGFQTVLERRLTLFGGSLRRPRPAQVPEEAIGFNPEQPQYFFFRATDPPQTNDRIFVVEWNRPRRDLARTGGQPTQLLHVYRVMYPEPFMAGELIYHLAHCQLVEEAVALYQTTLLSRPVTVSRL
jgi:hypothetical protein